MRLFFLIPFLGLKMEKLIPGSRELDQMIILHIQNIIRYSQKKNSFVYILYFRTDMWQSVLFLHFQRQKKQQTSTTPSCSGPIPAQRSRENSLPGAIFSHIMFEMNFYHFHSFSWEKIHQNDRSHDMVVSIITSPLSQVP